LPPWWTPWRGSPGRRGPYCGTARPPGLPQPRSSWWTPPRRPSGTRWPPAWRGTASGWRLGTRGLRRAGAPVGSRTPGSLRVRSRPIMGAATPPLVGGTPRRGWHRVGCRARRGGRAPRTGGRPRSTRTTRVTPSLGGTFATTARTRRVESRYPGLSGAPGRPVRRDPAPCGLVPSWVGSIVGGVCEGYPVLGVVSCFIPFFSS